MPITPRRSPRRTPADKTRQRLASVSANRGLITRDVVDGLALRLRVTFQAVRQGKADASLVNVLVQSVLLARYIGEATGNRIDDCIISETMNRLANVCAQERHSRQWQFDDAILNNLTAIINIHERQLSQTHIEIILNAINRLQKLLISQK